MLVLSLLFIFSLLLPGYAEVAPEVGASDLPPPSELDQIDTSGYLPPEVFFSVEDDYSISVFAVQTVPNTPVTSGTGLKGILISLFGSYDPTITQFRYQSNTSTNYTYVNDISPDFPWLCSAAIFGLMIFCLFRLWGAVLCRQ